jgi:hypothetical protein
MTEPFGRVGNTRREEAELRASGTQQRRGLNMAVGNLQIFLLYSWYTTFMRACRRLSLPPCSPPCCQHHQSGDRGNSVPHLCGLAILPARVAGLALSAAAHACFSWPNPLYTTCSSNSVAQTGTGTQQCHGNKIEMQHLQFPSLLVVKTCFLQARVPTGMRCFISGYPSGLESPAGFWGPSLSPH